MELSKIKKITKIVSNSDRYDVTVLNNHNYFANDILVHNSNISWVFKPDGNMRIAKRSGFIGSDESFYNHKIMYEKYADVIALLRNYVIDYEYTMNLYGEWFGQGIQKGVDYGPEKQLLFFDVIINDRLLTPFEMDDIFSILDIEDMMVPEIGMVDSLQKALDFPIEDKITEVYPEGKGIIEGIVIKPYYNTFFENYDPDGTSTKLGSTFYLKKKNESFKEIKSSKKKKPRTKQPEHVERLKKAFEEYITENRLDSVFSKEGEIQTDKDIGKYMKLFIEDAKEEFTKDYKLDIMDSTNKELKYVYNVSKIAVKMIMKRL